MLPLIDFFKSINEPKYRAQQLLKWIHQKGVTDFDLMTDFNKPLREKLKSLATLELPKVSKVFKSPEGTEKYLVELASGSMIEMVVIPEKKEQLFAYHLKWDALFNVHSVQQAHKDLKKILLQMRLLVSYGLLIFIIKIVIIYLM